MLTIKLLACKSVNTRRLGAYSLGCASCSRKSLGRARRPLVFTSLRVQLQPHTLPEPSSGMVTWQSLWTWESPSKRLGFLASGSAGPHTRRS